MFSISKIIETYRRGKQIQEEESSFTQRLQKSIDDACERVKQCTIREYEGRIRRREEELIREYEFKLAEKNAEIYQQIKVVEDLEVQVSSAQRAYQNYYQESVSNKRLIGEVAHQIERLFDTSGQIFQSFKNIQDAAEHHHEKMLEEDDENRNLLGMKKANKLLVGKK